MSDRVSKSPMEFIVRLDCRGNIDVAKFSEAIAAELKRQPLFQANATVGHTHRDSFWRPASNCVPQIQWCDGDPDQGRGFPDEFAPIDLESEIGFRFYGWRSIPNDQDRIVMKFVYHHACCDGKGGFQFAENVFHRYQCLMDNKTRCSTDVPAVDEQQLLSRHLLSENKLSLKDRIWRALIVRPKRVAKMLLSKPRVFSSQARIGNDGEGATFADPPRQCTTELSEEETKQLGGFAKKLSASTNTILARELFHTLNDHFENSSNLNNDGNSQTHGTKASRNNRDLRIMVPFSLRDERHQSMPVANCVSIVYLETSSKALEDDNSGAPALVSELVRQVDYIRRWNLQFSWIESINTYARVWPIVRLLKFGRKSRSVTMAPIATTVMTNLGRVFNESELVDGQGEFAVKGLVVESVHVLPPCNATISVNFSVNFYGNCLTLDASYLPSLIAQETAAGMLGMWKRRILDSVAGSTVDS